jgi:hypothetical protein
VFWVGACAVVMGLRLWVGGYSVAMGFGVRWPWVLGFGDERFSALDMGCAMDLGC